MVAAKASGTVKNIGVANFSPAQIDEICEVECPYAHQFELHPYLQQNDWVATNLQKGIHVTAYSPLGRIPVPPPSHLPPPHSRLLPPAFSLPPGLTQPTPPQAT